METLNFKTNINSSSCVTDVTPYLHEAEGIIKWKIDTEHPDNLLTVEVTHTQDKEVIDLIGRAGYIAERTD